MKTSKTFLVEPIINPLDEPIDRDESQDQREPLIPAPSPRFGIAEPKPTAEMRR